VIQTKYVNAVDGHGGEGLVDLDDIDIVLGQAVLGEDLWDGGGGADTHDSWGNTGDGCADEFGEDWLAEFDGFGSLHEEDGGGWGLLAFLRNDIELKNSLPPSVTWEAFPPVVLSPN